MAARSKTKLPLRYAFEMPLKVRLIGDDVTKFKIISRHHEKSLSQTSQVS